MKYHIFVFFCLGLAIVSCKKDSLDYREQYVGTYECTKSNRSFEDENFRTDIDDIIIELSSDSTISLDGTDLLLNADGTTGFQTVDGYVYNLTFEGNSFKLQTYRDVIGLAVGCFIIGERK